MARKIIEYINNVYDYLLARGVSTKVMKARLKAFSFNDKHADGEEDWKQKWSVLGKTNVHLYRLYSGFIGRNINIMPDDIMSNVIEPILNPVRYRSVYEDKCMIDHFLAPHYNRKVVPDTILRNIDSIFFNQNFRCVSPSDVDALLKKAPYKRIIVKPSIDSNSGKGICIFEKNEKDGIYYDVKNGDVCSLRLLKEKYKDFFVVQECISQSKFMSLFCETSVNTLRMHVYRSVETNENVCVGIVMRMGGHGALLDNMHQGGGIVGVNRFSGKLQNFKRDQHGVYNDVHNGISLRNSYIVPNFDKVKTFAESILDCLPHCRNLALDVALNENDEPILIEYNTDKFSTDMYQMTCGTVFEEYTDEVIDYCKNNYLKKSRVFVTF